MITAKANTISLAPATTGSCVALIYSRRTIPLELQILTLLLVVLQIADGVLTSIGIAHFGPAIEANIMIRSLVEHFGCLPALIGIKSLAVLIVAALCALAPRVKWIGTALKATIATYLLAAILPWGVLLM